MFSRIKRAWAVWVLASQSFSSKLDGNFGYDRTKGTTSEKVTKKRDSFTLELSIRMQNVQVECTDALRVIRSRDCRDAFHYCDPPYYNSDCGHYNGYTLEDYTELLEQLANVEGKFLLSSYPSDVLKRFTKEKGWFTRKLEQSVSVANRFGKPAKKKIEVMTANYDLGNPREVLRLF